ncbi:MAG: pantoate--beta-alanine ligase [Proteobacteria bacterium]|nr:pantoate--beta-alanine ligase [Pseudomonadota bacterium]
MTRSTASRTPMASIETVRTAAALRHRIAAWRSAGERVGLVPTMGGIHDGHLALVHAAREGCDRVAATLFVNPKQFGPSEDFATYPRDDARDARLLAEVGAELLFAPGLEEMYPEGFATRVSVSGVTEGLCGPHRPGFFDGVATVVCKLLMQALPDAAYFGEKDYQQLRMVRRMVADLAIPVDIVPVATVREADGLALSSRNDYLTASERQNAPTLYRVLSAIATRLEGGQGSVADLTVWGLGELEGAGFGPIDYLEVRDADTLEPVEVLDKPARVLAAAWLGKARLIDNVAVRPAR